mgnify:CR=1 FL=1|jgi:2-dehydro-3-deoxyphosphooctonate aldolase (KDO 8-P synthase)
MAEIKIGDISVGVGNKMVFMGGPCVIESREHALEIAKSIKSITDELGVGFVFKASFDKANRTSGESYRGPGIEEGMKILLEIRESLDVPVMTDFHAAEQIEVYGDKVDIVQIPAFLCRQTDLILAAGKTGKVVNIKKGQFLAPEQVGPILEKIKSTGNEKVMITERGYSFGYEDLVVDMRNFEIWKESDALVCFDASHSTQKPGALGGVSGGDRRFIPTLARSAVAAGIDVLFMEVHDNPEQALSDAATQFPLSELKSLLDQLMKIDACIK